MRTALVHDWLTGMRGGEKVLDALATRFPGAPIYTLVHNPGSVSAEIESHPVHTSFVQKLPGAARSYPRYLPLFPSAIERFDLREYDFVLSTSHCVAKGVVVHPGTKHLCYCHTPMRYVWSGYEDYFGAGKVNAPASWVLPWVASYLRQWDVTSAHRVDSFAANSDHVRKRIERFYGRPARVIHPLVDTDFYHPDPSVSREDFYLVVTALVPYKRVDLVLEVARERSMNVVIVGSGVERKRLEAAAPSTVSFLGFQSDVELRSLYRRCRALLFPGEEDFGIVPVEAQACGAPVIGLGRGGLCETVEDGVTGVHFAEARTRDFVRALNEFEAESWADETIRSRVERFGHARFEEEVSIWFAEEGVAEAAGGAPLPRPPKPAAPVDTGSGETAHDDSVHTDTVRGDAPQPDAGRDDTAHDDPARNDTDSNAKPPNSKPSTEAAPTEAGN